MKIVIIGATGTIGRAIVEEFSSRHEVISVAHSSGDIKVDITDEKSIEQMYQKVGKIDAVVLATGKPHFGALEEMKQSDYEIGLQNKLMGQVNVVLAGIKHINENGSFTLISGLLNRDPIRYGSSASMVNGAVEGFVALGQILQA